MAQRSLFWRNLGPDLDHIGAAPKLSQRLFRSPYRSGKNAREHDPLAAPSSGCMDDVEQAISEFKFWRFCNENRDVVPHSFTLPLLTDSAAAKDCEIRLSPQLTDWDSNRFSTSRDCHPRVGPLPVAPVTVAARTFAEL